MMSRKSVFLASALLLHAAHVVHANEDNEHHQGDRLFGDVELESVVVDDGDGGSGGSGGDDGNGSGGSDGSGGLGGSSSPDPSRVKLTDAIDPAPQKIVNLVPLSDSDSPPKITVAISDADAETVTIDDSSSVPAQTEASHQHGGKWCNSPDRTPAEIQHAKESVKSWKEKKKNPKAQALGIDDDGCRATATCVDWTQEVITIPTYFHVIHDGDDGAEFVFDTNPEFIMDQLDVINNAFRGGTTFFDEFEDGVRSYPRYEQSDINIGIQFCIMGHTATDNSNWYGNTDAKQSEFKEALHEGGMETLNVYVTETSSGVAGEATFPDTIGAENVTLDGVIVSNRVLPNSTLASPTSVLKEGDTFIHEVGHWLSLIHTFQDGCDGPGDYMEDAEPSDNYDSITAYEPLTYSLFGCPVGLDDCSEVGVKAPIHNFMTYRNDNCMDEFSPGQKEHLRSAWETYRHKENYSHFWGVKDDGSNTCCKRQDYPCADDGECCSGTCLNKGTCQ